MFPDTAFCYRAVFLLVGYAAILNATEPEFFCGHCFHYREEAKSGDNMPECRFVI